jgi:hypothetical protein
MSDGKARLRERLAAIIEDAATTFYGPSEAPLRQLVEESTADAMRVVAEWLRDEAYKALSSISEAALHDLADTLDPKETDR